MDLSVDLVEPVALSPECLGDLRLRFLAGKDALIRHFESARPTAPAATRLIRGIARHTDHTVAGLWEQSGMPDDAALLAVGGYGRGELFPHSDVDVLVLLPSNLPGNPSAQAHIKRSVEAFITACWDIGLEIGSSVRTVEECMAEAERDITVRTALLESRFLCGSRRGFNVFRRNNSQAMHPRSFLRAKTLEMRQRHQKFEDTPYSLEPNCKESPGGLRDLQVIIWVARAAGLGRNWGELATSGLATPFEVKQLQRNEGVLKLIRTRLHLVAGRREDRLVFDLQGAVAESFGYRATNGQRASEVLMRRYYWAAKAVAQLNQILMLNIEERVNGSQDAPMRPIDEHFLERDGMLEVVSDDLYQRHPQVILETFLTYQTTRGITGLSARTLRALYNSRDLMNAEFRRDPVNRATFMRILHAPSGHTHALRLMNETSVLGRYLWVFRRIVGQMQHDLFHVYTVDQHILMVLRNVRRFFIPEHAHEYPYCSQLAMQWDKPYVLYLAALFHDVAKGRGGDHSDLGAAEVRRFSRDHGVERDDALLIEFLVKAHLTMSRVAQKEDLSDPVVIQNFAQLVGTERRLTALYLLTVADIRGTSPKVWNAWKGKLLEDLYRVTLRALGGAQPHLDAEIEARKQEARHMLNLALQPPDVEAPLWKTLEISYFARHDVGEIAWHARSLHAQLDADTPVVKARVSPVGEGLQVVVYARDRADLFARICGYFDSAHFNILDAKVHTTRAGYALDTFQVINPHLEASRDGAPAAQYRDLISLVENQLGNALASEGALPEPSRGRLSRRVRSFPVTPRITLRPDERAQHWLLGVSASDRSGLLYAIARVLARHQINLQLAKITTLGERVEDTFLIDGSALRHNRMQIAIETELLDAIAA
ncbi:MAG: [protein-PII] uridylyltransferase [Pseudomonadota bacterium]|nr:[protein-PII] uridylyltransferase [Pseudomonadota bacterium]